MAWSFGEGWDLYTLPGEAINGYWDSGPNATVPTITTGRFAGSRAIIMASGVVVYLVKSSGQNDAVHHLCVAFQQTAAISGSSLSAYLQLLDGATSQVCIVFRSDGAILLTSSTPTGTVLATYTGAFPVVSTWYQFEFEVVINNTTGSFKVRKNGNSVDDFSATALNTRNSANNYANKLQVGQWSNVNQYFDDLFWRSDASSVAWMGDIRCFTRMPASDATAVFTRTPTNAAQASLSNSSVAVATATARYSAFTATYDGTISTATVLFTTGYTGNLKCSLFAASGNLSSDKPTTVLGSANVITNPATGSNTLTFASPVTITKGTQYFIGFASDVSSGTFTGFSGTTYSSTTAYAAFPVASPVTAGGIAPSFTVTITTGSNATVVNEAQQDATTSYVYSSTVNDADFYGVSSISSTPATVIACTTRAYAMKSDAGTRTMAVQLRSGSAVVLTSTTFNPSDKESHATLSGGNLIATGTAGWESVVRAIASQTSGKFYWECTFAATQNSSGVGVYASSVLLTKMLIDSVTGTCGVTRAGTVYVDGNPSLTIGGGGTFISFGIIASGTVICVALDATAKLIWFRLGAAGNWNNLAGRDPATGAGGVSIPNLGGSVPAYPAVLFGGADTITANFGATGFTGVVPSGFTSGFGTTAIGSVVASPTVVLTTSGWQWAWRTDTTDPNTGAAWTPAAVNVVQIGPKTVA